MSVTSPVFYSPDVETIAPEEQKTIEGLKEAFDVILKRTSEDYGHAVRSVHAKSHGILEGELTIDDGLPPELTQGLFATPGKHKVYLRISTNAGDILLDTISLPRGLAIKVLDVEGERLPDAEGDTQDFVLVNGPVFQAKTAKDFLGNLKMLAKTTDRMEGTKETASAILRGISKALGAVGIESAAVNSLGGAPNVEPLGETYYSVTPFRYGDYIAKFSLRPTAPAMTALTGKIIDPDGRPDAIREEVRKEMSATVATWDLRIQLCRDLHKQPIEDSTVLWDEKDSPFQKVGTIRAQAQDSWDSGLVKLVEDEMRFSIWTGLAAHRPLGNINRARKDPYRHSADYRARFNGCPYHEPTP